MFGTKNCRDRAEPSAAAAAVVKHSVKIRHKSSLGPLAEGRPVVMMTVMIMMMTMRMMRMMMTMTIMIMMMMKVV